VVRDIRFSRRCKHRNQPLRASLARFTGRVQQDRMTEV
jgi:hypothetical protein